MMIEILGKKCEFWLNVWNVDGFWISYEFEYFNHSMWNGTIVSNGLRWFDELGQRIFSIKIPIFHHLKVFFEPIPITIISYTCVQCSHAKNMREKNKLKMKPFATAWLIDGR